MPWIGVDFDGTLVTNAYPATGAPVPAMVHFVKAALESIEVRIFTNRADREGDCVPVREFCKEHFGKELPITATKDRDCVGIYDDIAYHVVRNVGAILADSREGVLRSAVQNIKRVRPDVAGWLADVAENESSVDGIERELLRALCEAGEVVL